MASESNSSKSAGGGEEPKGKSKSNQAVVDYLQAPRKKRKSYVVLAAGANMDSDTVSAIQKFMRTSFTKYSFVVARSPDDFLKYTARNIVLAIVDDELTDRDSTLRLVRKAKESKTDGPMPTLFLTKEPNALLKSYQRELQLYHEVDEYLNMADISRHAIFTKIKSGIESRSQRRGRRFKVSIPVSFQALETGETKYQGTIEDFSIYGALLSVEANVHYFSSKDQLLIHIPLSQYVKGQPDIFRVAARVRRVLISGYQAGISWEYMSDEKMAVMTKILTTIVDASLNRSAAVTRAKIAKAQAEHELTQRTAKPPP
jgi:hypothetical protein